MAPGSRRSARSSTPIPMPVIAEDENSADPRAGATTPTVPPRSPHRRPASSTRSNSYMGSSSTNSTSFYQLTRPSLSRSSSVPQYVPKTKQIPGIRAVGGDVGSVRSIPLNSNGSERWVIPPTVPTNTDREGKGATTSSASPARTTTAKGKSLDVTGGKRWGKDRKERALGGWVRRPRSRSGWYKVVILGILVVGLIVGLAVGLTVGLTVGLRKRNHSSDDPDPPLPTDLFPAGSYTFTAALTNLSASCAPQGNPSLWRCYPYTLYSPSMPANETSSLSAAASFRWIIRPITTYSYVIFSSDDPFSPTGTFRDVNLTMIDANQPSERFTFSFTIAKAVVPDVSSTTGGSVPSTVVSSTTTPTTTLAIALSSSSSSPSSSPSSASASQAASASNGGEEGNSRTLPSRHRRWFNKTVEREAEISQETATSAPAICWYNQTVVHGTIWTRMRASYPASITNVSTPLINATNEFAPWPFAVQLTLEQTYKEDERGNGKKAPDCRDAQGKPVVFDGYNNGNVKAVPMTVDARDLSMTVVDEANTCRCSYTNYGLDTIASRSSDSSGTTGTGNPQGGQSQGLG